MKADIVHMAAINYNNEPAFWHLPIDNDVLAGAAETLAMLISWFGEPLSEEDALDLALSAEIAEWNPATQDFSNAESL